MQTSAQIRGILMAGIFMSTSLVAQTPPAPRPSSLTKALSILLIGDSNTQNGHVSGGLAKALETAYGYYGSGYHSLAATVGNGSTDGYTYNRYFFITNTGSWTTYQITDNTPGISVLSPDGSCVQSSTAGSHTDVSFYGNSIDIYYLANTTAGQFTIAVDGGTAQTVNTQVTTQQTKKVSVTGLSSATHTAVITVSSGTVTLFGMDARVSATETNVAVVHKWGRSYGQTKHYITIDENRWKEALTLLNPDWVFIMLGTNDNEMGLVGWATVCGNEAIMASRICSALPNAHIVIGSTLPHGTAEALALYTTYWSHVPQLVSSIGGTYYDIWNYCGGSPSAIQGKGWVYPGTESLHFNPLGGDSVGAQLHRVILNVTSTPVAEQLTTISSSMGTPPNIGGLSLWYAGDAAMKVDEQGGVAEWNVPSGQMDPAFPYGVVQACKDWRPVRIANGCNGKPTVRFDGTNDQMIPVGGRGWGYSINAVSMVIKYSRAQDAILSSGLTYSATGISVPSSPGPTFQLVEIPNGGVNFGVLGQLQYLNGTTDNESIFQGEIAEIMGWDAAPSSATVTAARTYLQNKWLSNTSVAKNQNNMRKIDKNLRNVRLFSIDGQFLGVAHQGNSMSHQSSMLNHVNGVVLSVDNNGKVVSEKYLITW